MNQKLFQTLKNAKLCQLRQFNNSKLITFNERCTDELCCVHIRSWISEDFEN